MSPTPFASLASLGERLEATSKRLELTDLVAGFLQELHPAEIRPAVRLTIGQVFAEWDDRALKVSVGAAMRVLHELVDAAPEVRDQVSVQAVDPGHRAYLLV